MRFLRQTLAIAAKDLRSEVRGKEAVNAAFSFALVILLLFSFAFDLEPEQIREISGGLLWLVFAFAGTVAVIWNPLTSVNLALTPPKATAVVPVKPYPLMVTFAPTAPLVGVND